MSLNCTRVLFPLLLAAFASNAAVIQTYSTQPAFAIVTTGVTNFDFGSTALGSYGTSAGLTVAGVNIVGYYDASYSLLVATYVESPHFSWGVPVLKGSNTLNSFIQINLAAATAVSLHLATYWEGNPVQITLSSGETYTVNTPATGGLGLATFWGFTSDTPQSFVRIATIGGAGSPVLVDFGIGTASTPDPPADTPEAMTMLMMGGGLLALSGLKKIRFGNNASAA